MSKKLRYGIVGTGGCGCGKHLTSYSLYTDDVKIEAVCDIVPERAKAAAKKFGAAKIYTDYNEMFKDVKLDIVSVATPNCFHAPIAIAALQAGINVHSEKPIALNAKEAQAMTDAKNASGKKLLVGLNNRYTEQSLWMKQYIDEGHLGEIYLARCGWRRQRGIPGRGSWFTQKAMSGGGPMIDLGVHFFDLTMYLMGFPAPASISASMFAKFINEEPSVKGEQVKGTTISSVDNGICDVEDLATGYLKTKSGAGISFEFSWASNIENEFNYLELLGTKGGIMMNEKGFKVINEATGTIMISNPQVKNTTGWGENETKHFIDCVKNDKEPMSPPEQAVTMMRIIDAAYQSAASGKEVKL